MKKLLLVGLCGLMLAGCSSSNSLAVPKAVAEATKNTTEEVISSNDLQFRDDVSDSGNKIEIVPLTKDESSIAYYENGKLKFIEYEGKNLPYIKALYHAVIKDGNHKYFSDILQVLEENNKVPFWGIDKVNDNYDMMFGHIATGEMRITLINNKDFNTANVDAPCFKDAFILGFHEYLMNKLGPDNIYLKYHPDGGTLEDKKNELKREHEVELMWDGTSPYSIIFDDEEEK